MEVQAVAVIQDNPHLISLEIDVNLVLRGTVGVGNCLEWYGETGHLGAPALLGAKWFLGQTGGRRYRIEQTCYVGLLMGGERAMMSTFSIVACDLEAREWGVAVQSKFLAAGSVVPWARAEVGAIATQAWANVSYGPIGLNMLTEGRTADEVVAELVASDEGREHRQIGIVDAQGKAAAFTGSDCFEWAGHVIGEGYCCQGNILAGRDVVMMMGEAFERTRGTLADRLIAALYAGQEAGGDRRGQQSAALYVVKERGGYGGYTDRYIDLRVDDHGRPIAELEKLLRLFRLYFFKGDPNRLVKIEEDLMSEIATHLERLGFYDGPHPPSTLEGELSESLRMFYLTENFEERMRDDDLIDPDIVEFMRER